MSTSCQRHKGEKVKKVDKVEKVEKVKQVEKVVGKVEKTSTAVFRQCRVTRRLNCQRHPRATKDDLIKSCPSIKSASMDLIGLSSGKVFSTLKVVVMMKPHQILSKHKI